MQTILSNCQHCQAPFNAPIKEIKRGNGKFCSTHCANAHRHGVKKTIPNRECDWCKKPFHLSPSRLKQSKSGLYFCCRACKDTAQRLENGLSQLHPDHYGTASDCDDKASTYRLIALRVKKPECEKCGYKKYIEVLEVHHKDMNRRNNKIENLELLCPTCHMEYHFLTQTGRYTPKRIQV